MYDCYLVTEAECTMAEGWWQDGVESCDPNPCPYRRVCCVEFSCLVLFSTECDDAGGMWYSDLRTCEGEPCGNLPVEQTDWGTLKILFE